jgi:hypothetical protein
MKLCVFDQAIITSFPSLRSIKLYFEPVFHTQHQYLRLNVSLKDLIYGLIQAESAVRILG